MLWKYSKVVLTYRLGPWSLGQSTFRGARLETSFFRLNGHPALPDWSMVGPEVQVLVCPAVPVTRKLIALTFRRAFVRYVIRQEERYYVAFTGTFDEYLKHHFSKKPRYNLQRSVRKFAEWSGGKIAWAEMNSPADMEKFHMLAVAISQRSYQRELGRGFGKSAGSRRNHVKQAGEGLVRGYVLMHQERPVAFAFCKIKGEVISYHKVGYDPDFRDRSPGTVLLYLILERLFESKEFRHMDFGETNFFYKSFFATDHQLCAQTLHFRWRPSSLIAVVMHLGATVLSKMGSSALAMLRRQRLVPQSRYPSLVN